MILMTMLLRMDKRINKMNKKLNKKLKELEKKVNLARKAFIAADTLYADAVATLEADDASYNNNTDSIDAAILVDGAWHAWDIARTNRSNARDIWDNAIATYENNKMKNYKTIQEVRDCEELSEVEKIQIEYYEDMYCLSEALENYKNVDVQKVEGIDYAAQLFNEIYTINDGIIGYIDYEAFYNDLIVGGDIYQFNDEYIITNANFV